MVAILTRKKLIQCFYLIVVVLLFVAALNNFTSQLPTFSTKNTENITPELELNFKNQFNNQSLYTGKIPLSRILKTYWILSIQSNQITEILIDIVNIFTFEEGKYISLAIIGTILINQKEYDSTNHDIPKNRSVLKEMIIQNPGISLRQLQRKTELSMGVIQYHLHNLEYDKEIISMKIGKYKHFFDLYSKFSQEEKIWLTLIQNPKISEILNYLKKNNGNCYQRDIVHSTGNSRALISYYIKILKIKGIIKTSNNLISINEEYLTFKIQ